MTASVLWLLFTVSLVTLQRAIVVFPDHAYFLIECSVIVSFSEDLSEESV